MLTLSGAGAQSARVAVTVTGACAGHGPGEHGPGDDVVDGRAMATGSLPAVREGLGLITCSPQTSSVRQARRFVEQAVAASNVPALADDAGLLVSELAANAVLHARTDFDVAVYSIPGGVRVSVRDRSAVLPVLVAPSATAMSGRGLALVQALASQWGAGPSSSAPKSVWFELTTVGSGADRQRGDGDGDRAEALAGEPVTELSVQELLAAWSDDVSDIWAAPISCLPEVSGEGDLGGAGDAFVVGAPASTVAVVPGAVVQLPALDAADLLGAKEAMEDVLRELQLLLLGPAASLPDAQPVASPGPGVDVLAVAERLDAAARGFADVRSQVRHQVSRAVVDGRAQVVLVLHLGEGTAERASAYAEAVEAAEQLATTGSLLSVAGALARHRRVRRAYLAEVIAAASQ